MEKTTPIADTSPAAPFAADEVAEAYQCLSNDDKLKLYAIEATLLSGTGMSKGDLLQEAMVRALNGDRKCPRDVPFMAFLVESMKGITYHAREKQRRAVVMADPQEVSTADPSNSQVASGPESETVAASMLHEIYDYFQDDEEAMLVLFAWADGLRGTELKKETGLNQGQVDYAAKRIRIGARSLYPDGWKT